MTAVIEAQLKNGFGLRLIEYEILQQLQVAEAGTSLLGEVARGLFVHATTVSIATERLAARNLVERHGHPSDRRATLVTITDDGREVADAATAALDEVGCGLSGLTADQLASLADVAAVRASRD
jgi:DNA-binding MarR family transcriptional regulator